MGVVVHTSALRMQIEGGGSEHVDLVPAARARAMATIECWDGEGGVGGSRLRQNYQELRGGAFARETNRCWDIIHHSSSSIIHHTHTHTLPIVLHLPSTAPAANHRQVSGTLKWLGIGSDTWLLQQLCRFVRWRAPSHITARTPSRSSQAGRHLQVCHGAQG